MFVWGVAVSVARRRLTASWQVTSPVLPLHPPLQTNRNIVHREELRWGLQNISDTRTSIIKSLDSQSRGAAAWLASQSVNQKPERLFITWFQQYSRAFLVDIYIWRVRCHLAVTLMSQVRKYQTETGHSHQSQPSHVGSCVRLSSLDVLSSFSVQILDSKVHESKEGFSRFLYLQMMRNWQL